MSKSNYFVAIGFVVGAILLVSVNGGGMPQKMKCLDQEIDMKDCFKGFMECAATIMPADDVKAYKDPDTSAEKKKEIGMKAHKNMCVRVCQWKKHQHLIAEDGAWNKTAADSMVDAKFPEAARETLKTGLSKCHADNSKAFKDENECASYKPFEDCMTKVYTEACKIEAKDVKMDNMS